MDNPPLHNARIGSSLDIPILHDNDRYEHVKVIGSGNFGVARLMRHKDSQDLFAVKYIERGEKVCKRIFSLCPFIFFITHTHTLSLRFTFTISLGILICGHVEVSVAIQYSHIGDSVPLHSM